MNQSVGEAVFTLHCRAYRLLPETEYRFCENRRWRFDFAFPQEMLAVEIEGGTRSAGRHSRHDGFTRDAEKYNEAAIMGWKVLRFTTEQAQSGTAIDTVLRALRK